ncbi:TonB-linked outer membrane protein, SusC/RagA family [Pricia antarctica]|uniref:TonB-linked outer membrane protein, SusC/RagA family n=1 Tax=Pricia antarctica TaxID=641691 RepID=A0A1G6YCP5_9FLAO|nr:TonB-linked outer membrane protein, SusC/RagA family [Pricia antarctica]
MKKLFYIEDTKPYKLKVSLKMKLTVFLTIVSLFQIHANTYSQSKRISLDMPNATVAEIIQEIESHSDFKFLLNRKDVDLNREISINVEKQKITTVLAELFSETNVEWQVMKKQIILKKKSGKVDSSENSTGDTKNEANLQFQVSGTVTNVDDRPLPGASILEKGTTNGVQTDFDGNFSITLSDQNATLVISYIGFASKEVALDGRKSLSITLAESAEGLDEVVVVAYGTSDKRSFTGAAETVNSEALTRGSTASFETALQGKVSGINISTSGQPGGKSNVQIRGIGSISGNTQPLYVLDGVVINTNSNLRAGDDLVGSTGYNPLSTINSEDIKSITVLKDAAASSLYGSRAANGVIIITTKDGKKGETEITLGVETGWSDNLTEEKLINNEQFKGLWIEGQTNQYIQNNENAEFTRVYGDNTLYNTYENQAVNDYEGIYGTTNANSDWLDAIYQNGLVQKYNLSARGGSDKTSFYVSGDYLDQAGTIIETGLKRYSGRVNLENQAKDWVKLGINLSLAKTERNAANFDGTYAGGLNPLYMARVLPPAAPINDSEGFGGFANLPNDIEKNANPIGVLKVGKYENTEFRVRGNAYTEFQILDPLTFKTTFGIDQQAIDETLYDNKVFGAGGGIWNGVLNRVKSEVFQYTVTNLLNYNDNFGNHGIEVLLGQESQVSKMNSINVYGYDILDSELLSSSSIGTLWSHTGYAENYSLLSYFSQASYNFGQKYYLSTSLRQDGSSRFGKDSRWGTFWSISGAWVASEEDFLNIDGLDYMKFRGSYGTNGNLPPQYYAALAFFATDEKGYGGESGLSYGQIQNPDLSWELSKNFNVGVDINLFNKLNLTANYFNKKTEDLLLNVPVSLTTGFMTQLQNFGEMTNKGWEFEIGYDLVSTEDFYWRTSANLTVLDNKITKLKNDIIPTYSSRYGQDPLIIKEGESIYSFYLRDYAGVDPSNGYAQYYVLNNGERTGELTTDAQEAGYGIFGDALQDFQGGLFNQLNYKDFTIDFQFTFGLGGKVYDRTAFQRDDDGFAPQYTNTVAQLDPWNPNNTNATVPIRINGNPTFSNDVSTRHLYNSDYLKLKNVKLSYNLPILSKIIKGGSIYIQGNNLFLVTELDGYDPESVVDGVNFFQVPTSRTILLGLQLQF